MNIVKIKDIELTNIKPAKDENCEIKHSALFVDWSDEQVNKFNGKFRDRYVHAINWKYAIPVLDSESETPFGIDNDKAKELSRSLTIEKEVSFNNDSMISTFANEASDPSTINEIEDPWTQVKELPANLGAYDFIIGYINNTAKTVHNGVDVSSFTYIPVEQVNNVLQNNDTIYINPTANAQVYSIESNGTGYYIVHNTSGDKHYLKMTDASSKGNISCTNGADSNSNWDIAFNNGYARIVNKVTGSYNELKANLQSPRIKGYSTSSSQTVLLFAKAKSEKQTPEIVFENSTITKHLNDEMFTNRLTGKDASAITGTYYSSNEEVALVDDKTGEVMLSGSTGRTIITFTSKETDIYKSISIQYILDVTEAKKDPELFFVNGNTYNCIEGESIELICLSTYDDFDAPISYISSNEDIATIDEDGIISTKKPGSCIIMASSEENDEYKASSIECTITVQKDTLKGYDWFSLDTLSAYNLIDESRTSAVNSTTKYIEYNRFSNSYDDLTTEELKQFRTWLAKSILNIHFVNDDVKKAEEKIYKMISYYAQNMDDTVVKSLALFSAKLQGEEVIYITNNANKLLELTGNKCGCSSNSSISQLDTKNLCDPLAIYKNYMYNQMVETFSRIDFWISFEDEFIKEIIKYLKGILEKNFLLYNKEYTYDLFDCNCLNDADAKQTTYMQYLQNLIAAFEACIPDESGNRTIYSNSITHQRAFELWARYLYESMYWA